jgi:serine/threonine protein kinase
MQIVLWELLTEKRPYEGKYGNIHQLIDAVSNRNERPEIPENCPKKLRQLMERCWHKDPKQRPSFQEILESKVFDDIILEALTQGNEACQQMWKNFGPVSIRADSRIKRPFMNLIFLAMTEKEGSAVGYLQPSLLEAH